MVLISSIATFPPTPSIIYFVPGNGEGTFRTAVVLPGVTQAVTVTSGDFNGDGKLDLAYLTVAGLGGGTITKFGVLQQSLAILLGNGDGTFKAGASYPLTGPLWALSAADINGDGFLDLYSAGARTEGTDNEPISVVVVMLGDGKGNFKQSFSGQDCFAGEDQINIALPASLAGAGVVSVALTVDGQTSNSVQIQIK